MEWEEDEKEVGPALAVLSGALGWCAVGTCQYRAARHVCHELLCGCSAETSVVLVAALGLKVPVVGVSGSC